MAKQHECSYRSEAEDLRAQVAAMKERLDELERTLAGEKRRAIGRTTERKKPTPKGETRPKNDERAQAKRKANRETRDSAPVESVEHRIPDPERMTCSACGGSSFIDLARDVSSEYEWKPGRLVRKLHMRETRCCSACKQIVRAPAPARVVDGGQYGPGFLAHTITQKCADCIPLHRQVKALAREGLHVAPSTLVDLFHRGAGLIEPIYLLLLSRIPTSPVVYADETSLKMQRVEKLGFVWTFASPEVIVYRYSADRSGDTPGEVLGESEGVLVVDGYTGYNHVTKPGRRRRAGCSAHARRKFVDIDDDGARLIVERFGDVFRVERDAAEKNVVGTPQHLEMRQTRSKAAMDALKKWCDDNAGQYGPKSPMGQAIGYIQNQWDPLTVFLDDIRIEPSNMISERLLRTIALGRKNYLFVGHKDAGQNLAMLCSIISTCVLHGVNPTTYLADVFIRVQTHPTNRIDELAPHRWKQLGAAPTAE